MLNYVAVTLGIGGDVVRDAETSEVMNVQLGECDSPENAIDSACEIFNCKHVMNGVIVKGNNTGGHMIMDTQELSEL
ncbi:hypothetical protein L4C39_04675 [Vibrio clamense]|uniref:hypothetical protein n=1 Tax=Vibrio clamense TaxID=2910254 RepID=UPI003D219174